jgi:putative hydrolase of the HAD superfamily
LGGTLDGDGVHWLERFADAYAAAGSPIQFQTLRAAFDVAEQRSSQDEVIASAGLTAMVARHLSWQLEHLGIDDDQLRGRIATRFEEQMRATAQRHVPLLATLGGRGLKLGVVSNGCGNVRALCEDFGYAPFLAAVVDSRRAGVAKPDPRIYAIAADALGLPPQTVMMVGDSFDRDIVPARAAGMHTAWLHRGRPCPDATAVDLMLASLRDLSGALAGRGWTAA